MNIKKKLFAILFSIILFVTFIPVPVFADGEDDSLTNTVTIEYRYEKEGPHMEGTVSDAYEAAVPSGDSLQTTIISPVRSGYIPYLVDESAWDEDEERWMIDESTALSAETVDIDIELVGEDETYYVVYVGQDTTYTVHFYLQNLNDDNYAYCESRTETAKAGSSVPMDLDYSAEFPGFTQLEYEGVDVAADGSTVVNINFARDYHLINFSLGGGYGVTPIYARYGSLVHAAIPTRAGFVFNGWRVTSPENIDEEEKEELEGISDGYVPVPAYNATLEAQWGATDSSYTIVYWRQNADDDGYSYWGSKTVSAASDSVVSGSGNATYKDVDATSTTFKFFSYNDTLTDKNVVVAGDGSSVVNVYYDRILYTFNFVGYGQCCLEETADHTHTEACFFDYDNGIHTHNQFCYVLPEGYSLGTASSTSDCYTKSDGTSSSRHRIRYLEDSSLEISFGYLQKEEGGDRYYYVYWDKNDGNGKKYYYLNDENGQVHYPAGTDRNTFEASFELELGFCSYAPNVIYSFQARYEQNIGDLWPDLSVLNTLDNVYKIDGNASDTNGNVFSKWALQGLDVNSSSKRLTIPSDFCRAAVDGVVTNNAVYAASLNDCVLNYMFESFDQETASTDETMRRTISDHYTSSFKFSTNYDEADFDTDKVKYYDQNMLYHEDTKLDSQGVTNKAILGFNPVGRNYENIKDSSNATTYVEYLYYVRKRSNISFYNVDSTALTINNVMFEMPLSEIRDSQNNLISSYIPPYPSSYEPGAYVFDGWYTTPGCFPGTEVTFDETMPANELMIYAKWNRVDHSVKVFKSREDMTTYTTSAAPDESLIFFEEEVGHGSVAALQQLPMKKGYLFDGWFYLDEGVKKEFTFNGTAVTKDMNVFAEWKINNHPVHNEVTASATVGNLMVKVTGELPVTATLSASLHEVPEELLTETEDVSIVGLDLELYNQGYKIQPDDTVRVSISGMEMYENPAIEVVHVLDTREAILNGIENGTAIESDDPVAIAAHPAEADLAYAVTGKEDIIYAEYFSSFNDSINIDNDSFTFETDSFSTYYVVSGDSRAGAGDKSVINIDEFSGDTRIDYYVSPGTTIEIHKDNVIQAHWRANKNNTGGALLQARNDGSQTLTNITTSNYSDTTGDYLRATFSSTATIGEEYHVESWLHFFITLDEKDIYFHVVSEEDVVDNILNPTVVGTQYPVYLSVVNNATNGVPWEPSVADTSLYSYADSGFNLGGISNHYATNGSGIISSNIYSNPYFVHAADSTNTMGIVDNTGLNVRAAVSLTDADFDAFYDKVAASGNVTVRTSGGGTTTLNNSNKQQYKLIPYVVKLQTVSSIGWHIQCMVVPNDAVSVEYNANIPEGITVDNISVPNSQTDLSPVQVTFGNPMVNGSIISLNGNVTARDNGGHTYTLKFKGWNTKSDGSGTTYNPGGVDSFDEDTILYAEWESNLVVGILEIHKVVAVAEGSQNPPIGDAFAFTVNFNSTDALPYIIYNTTGAIQGSGNISNGGTISLQGDQWVRISNVPTGNYSVSETSKAYYTISSTGATGTIRGGATSTAEFTNTYANYSVTGSFDGGHGTVTNNNQTDLAENATCQAMVFTPAAGYKITDVKVNGTSVTGFTDNGYTFSAQQITESKEVVAYTDLVSYTISYSGLEGATLSPANPTSYNVETATITLNNPTKEGYIFLGWTGSNGTTPQTEVTIPTGSTGNKNYTANWKRETASLTVQKSGWNSIDENQAFIFHVEGLDSGTSSVSMDIVVIGNGSTTIAELPTGRYQITENSDWSWRYASESAKTVTVTYNETNEVTFTNARTITQWLNGQASVINKIFGN